MSAPRYYDALLTLTRVETERLDLLEALCRRHQFRILPGVPVCARARSGDRLSIVTYTRHLAESLRLQGFRVTRTRVVAHHDLGVETHDETIVDERHEETA